MITASAAFQHSWQRGLGEREWSGHVHPHQLVDVVRAGRANAARGGVGAGVVYQDVETAEVRFCFGHHLASLVWFGDVRRENERAAAVGFDHFGSRFQQRSTPTDQRHRRSLVGQRQGGRAADPAAAAGDQSAA